MSLDSRAGVVYDIANIPLGANTSGSASPIALRLDFDVNVAGNVTAIGAVDFGGSFSGTIPVAIYRLDTPAGTQVPGTLVSFTSSGTYTASPLGGMKFQNITPVFLSSGSYAIVAANFTSNDQYYDSVLKVPEAVAFDSQWSPLAQVNTQFYYDEDVPYLRT